MLMILYSHASLHDATVSFSCCNSDSAFITMASWPSVVSRCFQESSDVEQDYTKLSDILKATRQVFSCWPFVTVTLGTSMDNFVVSSALAFMPKILESKFRLTPGRAVIYYGGSSIPAAFLGNIVGETRTARLKPLGHFLTTPFLFSNRHRGNTIFCRAVTPILGQWLHHKMTNARAVLITRLHAC